jgi:uncharacterized circularly permuted ATP-grasp superfamily protein/uncharacterized alpha-E superfamily protein
MPESGILSVSKLPDLSAYYAPRSGVFDEFLNPNGDIRPHWMRFAAELGAIDAAEYGHRLASARGMVRDNGVTYNVYDDAGGEARPWDLDLLPVLMSPFDWAQLEKGIKQRARLANAFLADVYGPQRLIAEGVIPPHLVSGHPQYLRPLQGTRPPGGVFVHFLSVDVARAPDGSWVMLSQRVDAPAGVGYALENRIVVSQTFPELFRDLNVQRLAAFFNAYRESVVGLANAGRPRRVLLTPGPYNEAYFEHAYIARYLNVALVEGNDLVVRDGALFLKTLSGLERVDVLFRRVDSNYCDPLELRPDSALGVPGLVEIARGGKTVIANALGGGVAESPALMAFEHKLSAALLGEPLMIPGMPTLWCGNEDGRAAAMASLDRWVLRGAFDTVPLFAKGSSAKPGAELSAAERTKLADLMERRGEGLVLQKVMSLGSAPLYEDGRLVPRPVALRLFAAYTPQGYEVMPGALARVARDDNLRSLALQAGAASKDTWVLADGPVDRFSLLKPQNAVLRIRRTGDEAPSRAMDNLFWLGRYAERAEHLVRVARAVLLRLGDDTGLDAVANAADLAQRLLVPLNQATPPAAAAAAEGDVTPLTLELNALVFDRAHPEGLQRMLQNVERTAWSVRDRLSVDTWRTTLAFTASEEARVGGNTRDPAGARGYLDALVRRSAALSGLAAENMTRGPNWLFLELGRRIERALNLTRLVRQTFSAQDAAEDSRLPMMLEIADSSMTYRSRYLGDLQAVPVLDLLLLDESNPRAVAFQAETVKARLDELPRVNAAQARGLDKEIVGVLLAKLWSAEGDDATGLAAADERGRRAKLTALLDVLEQGFTDLGAAIGQIYFQHMIRRRAGFAPRREMR